MSTTSWHLAADASAIILDPETTARFLLRDAVREEVAADAEVLRRDLGRPSLEIRSHDRALLATVRKSAAWMGGTAAELQVLEQVARDWDWSSDKSIDEPGYAAAVVCSDLSIESDPAWPSERIEALRPLLIESAKRYNARLVQS